MSNKTVDIYFNPGMFGSTIEYLLREYTNEFKDVNDLCLHSDGSMHGFKKEFHRQIDNIDRSKSYSIGSFFYPSTDSSVATVVANPNNKNVIISAKTFNQAELNLLFHYNKVVIGSLNMGFDAIFDDTSITNITQWNANAKSWKDLQPWELRELISLYYPGQLESVIEHGKSINSSEYCNLTNTDILFDLKSSFEEIVNYLGISIINNQNLIQFTTQWTSSQQYIIQQYQTVKEILAQIINLFSTGKSTFWWKDLNIIQEAMVQKGLRDLGYEIRCDGLNKFPNNIAALYSLLEI